MASVSMVTQATNPTFMAAVDGTLMNEEQKGAVASIRLLEAEIATTPMSGEQVKAAVAELLPPAVLFGPSLIALPYLHRDLRNWLNARGANLEQHSSHRIKLTLATALYPEAEERTIATELATEVEAAGRRPRSSSTQQESTVTAATSSTPSGGSADRAAHNVAMRFRDQAAKFSGNLGESWSEYVAEYQQVARDYEMTASQKLQYLHNLLRGDAKRFYLDRVHGTAATFAQAVDMVSAEYNSIVRQDRVKNYLSGLRLSSFVKDGTDVTAALEKTYKTISKLAPQVPRSHHGESYKVEFLRNAVVGNSWATEPLSRIATHRLTFQQLYGELEAALHLHNEARLAVMRDEVAHGAQTPEANVPGIFFAGQGRYMHRNKDIGKRFNASKGSNGVKRFDPMTVMGCFNCDDRSHSLGDCPHPINAVKAAKRRLEYYAKKRAAQPAASTILYQLCSQLDAAGVSGNDADTDVSGEDDDASSAAQNDVDIFEALVEAPDVTATDDHAATPEDPDFA
ncbi:hypothetical protein MMPV_004811 [Pyropia vietnamensis]